MVVIPVNLRANLVTLYSEPHRKYHNLNHIMHCIREMHEAEHHVKGEFSTTAIELAIWFHDAIYDPKSTLNELQSAQLAINYIGKNRDAYIEENLCSDVWDMILATRNHFQASPGNLTRDIFLDIDMSILGQHEDIYDDYAAGIAFEYKFAPRKIYSDRRTVVLQEMLDQPYIYRTEYFRGKYESKARQNIKDEISVLTILPSVKNK